MGKPVMPKVKVYPLCSECHRPYVLRLAFVFSFGKPASAAEEWVWQRDCKHKKAPPESSAPKTTHAERANG